MSGKAKVDPELTRQLAGEAEGTVEAVVFLRGDEEIYSATPQEALERGESVVRRVEKELDERPDDLTIFSNLQMMAIRASRPFVARLLEQPEVVSATANQSDEADGESE